MTTIVANLECMAADQRCTGAGAMCHVQKIYRIGTSLFGYAGDSVLGLALIEWLDTKRSRAMLYKLIPESHRNDIDVLELSPEGLAFWNGWGVRLPLLDKTYAIGSGSMAALQALRMGSAPRDAVIHAMQMDECSGVLTEPEVQPLVIPRKRAR